MSTAYPPGFSSEDARFAIESIREASRMVAQIQFELVPAALTKDDRSPVTVADFACQALVAYRLMQAFPADALLAEEDSSSLRAHPDVLQLVSGYVRRQVPQADPDLVRSWIDHGRYNQGENNSGHEAAEKRTWVLDPVDGTKGFLRGDQYALALALLVDGQVQLGALGCPRLDSSALPGNGPGALFIARRGAGAWAAAIDGLEVYRQLHASTICDPISARILRSFEAGHTNTSRVDEFVQVLGCQGEPVRMDSQAKYAQLAAGRGDLLLRLLSPSQPDYRERIWDQAAGSLLLEEAGGRISDLRGAELDFRAGRTLANNYGILASNGCLHEAALNALRQIGV